ncbi:homing endonuclease [Chloriridovirus anopheles1]|uniref:Zinc-ribbon-containing protein n=1 Tax=Chloriridovirus anopheles1 TaxID=1465751 RepID=W8R9L2_9VIRU|nr:homing endonuclease [Anopheles minimus iridovirus]AHL67536.1 zinc-ribbon-containing protein [Anopheles minimus iridovirus]
MGKYENYVAYLQSNSYTTKTTLSEFETSKKITFECQNGHLTTLSAGSFANKKAKKVNMCSGCNHIADNQAVFEERKTTIFNSTGHILLSLDGKKAEYKCGTCGEIRQTDCGNLLKPTTTAFCGSCIPKNKKTEDSIRKQFEQLKIDLDIPSDYTIIEYENNKNVTFRCDQQHTFKTSYFDLKRGRRCPICAKSRREQTNIKKYGASNPFSNDEIKDKIKQTCLTKYGKTHHMQVDTIRKKAEETNLQKIGVKYAFHTPSSFEKIRKTCLLRYGAEFPLQSIFIQSKVTQTWLNKIGGNRPMCNQQFWKNCLMGKYGVDHYSKTDQFKIDYANTCLGKYGVDHYSKTDQFKIDYANTCLGKYGVDHPMKLREVFERATRNSFCRKPFVYPSGRIDLILGYEGVAIKELLETYKEEDIITSVWCIPTFKYKRVSSVLRPMSEDTFAMSVYYPDILLPDKIIEVKSLYLYNRDSRNVCRKMMAVAKEGYCGELWVYKNEKTVQFRKSYRLVNGEIVIRQP